MSVSRNDIIPSSRLLSDWCRPIDITISMATIINQGWAWNVSCSSWRHIQDSSLGCWAEACVVDTEEEALGLYRSDSYLIIMTRASVWMKLTLVDTMERWGGKQNKA